MAVHDKSDQDISYRFNEELVNTFDTVSIKRVSHFLHYQLRIYAHHLLSEGLMLGFQAHKPNEIRSVTGNTVLTRDLPPSLIPMLNINDKGFHNKSSIRQRLAIHTWANPFRRTLLPIAQETNRVGQE